MSIIINGTEIKNVVFNGVELDTVKFNNIVVFNKIKLINFTGIDSNGNLETDDAYNGVPVEYAVGKATLYYYYYKYTQVNPTPTDINSYNSKYVYDTSSNKYTQCVVTTNEDGTKTISPSWVLVGTTPAYTKSSSIESFKEPQTDPLYELDHTAWVYTRTNGINQELYPNIDLSKSYHSSEVPDLGITEIVIPDTYKGKPVTKILSNAFYSYEPSDAQNLFYVCYNLQSLKLGNNIKILDYRSLGGVTRGKASNANGLILNNNLEDIGLESLLNCFKTSIELPTSVKTMTGYAVGWSGGGENAKLTVKSNITYKTSKNSNGLYDYVGTVIFEQSVTEVTGNILYSPAGQNKTTSLVFKHSVSDSITIDVTAPKSATNITIYTDNTIVKNYDWAGKNFTVTFKSLSEYVE